MIQWVMCSKLITSKFILAIDCVQGTATVEDNNIATIKCIFEKLNFYRNRRAWYVPIVRHEVNVSINIANIT